MSAETACATCAFFVVEDHALTNLGIREFLDGKAVSTPDGFRKLICAGYAASKSEAEEKLSVRLFYNIGG